MKFLCAFFATAFVAFQGLAIETNLPATLSTLNQWYQEPPAGQNGATKLLAGIAELKISEADKSSTDLPLIGNGILPHGGMPVSPKMKTAISDFVARNGEALSLLREAAKFQHFRYPIDLNYGASVPLPHLLKLKQAVQTLVLASISEALSGRSPEAIEDLRIGFALAASLESEPVGISQIVRVACNANVVKDAEEVFSRATLSAESLSPLQTVVERLEQHESDGVGFTRALVGEQVTVLSQFQMSPEEYLAPAASATPEERKQLETKIKETLAADRRHSETTFARAMAGRKNVFPQRLGQDKIFVRSAIEATNNNWLLSGLLLPQFTKIATREASNLALLRLVKTAVALERYRIAHTDRYPETLAELTPNYLSVVPHDPFNGAPLRYRGQANGYVLYSIGPDLKDDDGIRIKKEKGDIIFEVMRSPLK